MWKIILIAALAIILILGLILYIRHRKFKPNPNKDEQYRSLNNALENTGFAYHRRGDYFYTPNDCWQRETGYCRLYDEGAPLFNMVMDCEPIEFSYNSKRWLIELWKGQYGITTGAEIGLYNTDKEDIVTDKFTGPLYSAAADDERLKMSFVLYKNGKRILKRSGLSWWLTAFKLGEFSERSELIMKARLVFPNREMCEAFTSSLIKTGYTKEQFSVGAGGKTVRIIYSNPHTPQSLERRTFREKTVQAVNKNNCRLYNTVTAKYSYTPDKLEYIKSFSPELFDFALNSLYGKAFYEAFKWLFDKDKKPEKPPCNPCGPPVKVCRCVCRHVGCSCEEFCENRCRQIRL